MDWYTFIQSQQLNNGNAMNIDQKYNWQILGETDMKEYLAQNGSSPLPSPSSSPSPNQGQEMNMGMNGLPMNMPMNPMGMPMGMNPNLMYQLPGMYYIPNGQSGNVTTSNNMMQTYTINTNSYQVQKTEPQSPQPQQQHHQPNSTSPTANGLVMMESFPTDQVRDFKHVIYNLLVLNHNNAITKTVNPNAHMDCNFITPCSLKDQDGIIRTGFKFNEAMNPEKRLPEIYAQHVRKAKLEDENQSSVLIQDLYKYYMRACVELLGKYFEKVDKYTYLYDDIPLFIPNSTLGDAAKRIKSMKTRARRRCTT